MRCYITIASLLKLFLQVPKKLKHVAPIERAEGNLCSSALSFTAAYWVLPTLYELFKPF